ncbi:hypothetical protein Tco_0382479, partial [Tanacetum coccineum]
MKKKKLSQGAGTSGIFTVELYSFHSTSWVYDTGCGTHICITTQGLRRSRELKPGSLSLYVGDGHRAAVEAIGDYHLCLPSGLVLILHNCHYALSITRGIISVSRLHINKKRIEKMQLDGLLNSTNIKSFEKCVACMSGKMARKPYSTSSGKGQRSTWTNPHRCTDKSKNHKKTVKNKQARTREPEEYKAEARK